MIAFPYLILPIVTVILIALIRYYRRWQQPHRQRERRERAERNASINQRFKAALEQDRLGHAALDAIRAAASQNPHRSRNWFLKVWFWNGNVDDGFLVVIDIIENGDRFLVTIFAQRQQWYGLDEECNITSSPEFDTTLAAYCDKIRCFST